jgi:hypothetical protein
MFIKQFMGSNMKNVIKTKTISLVALLMFVNILVLKANVGLSGFSVYSNYLISGRLKVVNPSIPTKFQFSVQMSRQLLGGSGSYEDGACTISLVWMSSPNASGSGSIEISSIKQVTNANYLNSNYATINNIDATLPANVTSGAVFIKLIYFDTNQQKTLTRYISDQVVNIQYSPPAPVIVDIFDLVIYPARRTNDDIPYFNIEANAIGIKLPVENLELKWNSSKLNSAEVNAYLYEVTNSTTGPALITKIKIQNTGSYTFNFSGLNVRFYNYKYYVLIEDSSGNKIGRSGIFRFTNDHTGLFDDHYPNAFWIFRPDSSGSAGGSLTVDWFSNRINGNSVSIDLYNSDGSFYKKLVNSTPNNGHFQLPYDSSIPLGPYSFYQFKITSIENPSEFGYSEEFHHWLD